MRHFSSADSSRKRKQIYNDRNQICGFLMLGVGSQSNTLYKEKSGEYWYVIILVVVMTKTFKTIIVLCIFEHLYLIIWKLQVNPTGKMLSMLWCINLQENNYGTEQVECIARELRILGKPSTEEHFHFLCCTTLLILFCKYIYQFLLILIF
jgi:hypothetical protein